MEIYAVTKDELGEAWEEVVGDRELTSCIVADFGLADAVVCLMTFGADQYEVGHGECLRPYNQLYLGDNLEEASQAWLKHVAKLGA